MDGAQFTCNQWLACNRVKSKVNKNLEKARAVTAALPLPLHAAPDWLPCQSIPLLSTPIARSILSQNSAATFLYDLVASIKKICLS
ncbi:hypothetical protein KCU83_g494, partial [Aureobasidium melanogenum]